MTDHGPFPILKERGQPSGTIPLCLAEIAYEEYARRFGRSQSLERMAERGGFGRVELVKLIRGENPLQ